MQQALEHPYMAELHDPDDEPECDAEFDFDYEKKVCKLSVQSALRVGTSKLSATF